MQLQQTLYTDLFKAVNERSWLTSVSNGVASAYPFVLCPFLRPRGMHYRHFNRQPLRRTVDPEALRRNRAQWLNRMQTVCFSPMAKLNGWASGTQPWSFPEVYPSVLEAIELRMQLLPYLYSAYATYQQDGIPPFRAMILEDNFKSEERVEAGELDGETNPYALAKAVSNNDQFMFGPSILVAPFYGKQALERSIVLPAGNWYNFYTGELAGNGETIRVSAEDLQDRIPLFVKDGAVIPMLKNPVLQSRDARAADLVVRHYGQAAGSFDLYEDDATTFNYQQGEFRTRSIGITADGSLELEISGTGPQLFGEIVETRQMSQ